jgi:hypothetical protein
MRSGTLLRRVLAITVGAFFVGGCNYCAAAAILCADVRDECEPSSFENQCPDPHTTLNCMPEQEAGCPERWHPITWPCDAPNECALIDGIGACVAVPVERCELGRSNVWPSRCVDGALQQCMPITFELDVALEHGYWRDQGEPCAP